jgi:hypothetical protein
MTLDFLDPDKSICVLTDASDSFYAGLVTQIHEEQLDISMEEQDHQPLALLAGEVKGAQQRWTVPVKEGFVIVDTATKVDYLLLNRDEFSNLFDHFNLSYIYNPLSVDPALAHHVEHKLQRWALNMSVLAPHGARDWRAQLLDRSHDEMGSTVNSRMHGKMACLFRQPHISPPDYDTMEYPSKEEILLAQ